MSAYVLVDIEITDPAGYEEYKKLAPASLAAYNGKFKVRGGAWEIMEGHPTPGRLVILEFPSLDRARAWWNSADYADAKAIRQRTARTHMILVEGVDE